MGVQHSKTIRTLRSSSSKSSLGGRQPHAASLVSLLQRQEWDRALLRIESHPREARIAVLVENKVVYPLHAACAFPEIPLNVIQALIQADPDGPKKYSSELHEYRPRLVSEDTMSSNSSSGSSQTQSSSTDWLPLHVAVYYGASYDVIECLLREYPSAILCKNGSGFLPLHLAVMNPTDATTRVVSLFLQTFPGSRHIPASSPEHNKTAYEMVLEWPQAVPDEELLYVLQEGVSSTTSEEKIHVKRIVQSLNPSSAPKFHKPDPHVVPTKLTLAIATQQWEDVLKRLAKKPKEASVWTLSASPVDPPCHFLPLHLALRDRAVPLDVVQALVAANPEAVRMREWYGMYPLHIACQSGAPLPVVKLLVERYPEAAGMTDLEGLTPLHLACLSEACRRDVILYLLEQNAESMSAKDKKGFVPRDYIVSSGHPHQRALLQDFGRGEDYWAATTNRLMELLLDEEWEDAHEYVLEHPEEAAVWTKSRREGKRQYALHCACANKAPGHVVEALVKAHPEALQVPVDEYELLPLHLACQHGGSAIVVSCLLQHYKEAASIADTMGLLPLHLAVTEGASVGVVEALVKAHPQAVSAKDSKGFTPLVYAESSLHPSAKYVRELLGNAGGCGATRPALESFGRPQSKRQKSDRSLTATSG